jgi:copper chaperone CopZ
MRAAAAAEEDDEPWEIDLQVTGMVCDGCSSNVKSALAAAQGVSGVEVDLAAGVATVQVQAENAVRGHAQLSRVCGGHPLTRSALRAPRRLTLFVSLANSQPRSRRLASSARPSCDTRAPCISARAQQQSKLQIRHNVAPLPRLRRPKARVW